MIATGEELDNNTPQLIDNFGREHNDMRISLTDKCNFRCTYCMKEDQVFEKFNLELTTPELLRIAKIGNDLGINAVRLTGGEPLIRKDAVDVVAGMSEIGFEDIAMTTNGSKLARKVGSVTVAQMLKDAGLQRVNISCDSLNPEKFAKIRRRGDLDIVMNGLEAAREAELGPIKMNTVVIRGVNDDEVLDFVEFSRRSYEQGSPVSVRFIEFMPLGETGENQTNWSRDLVVSSAEVIEKIKSKYPIEVADTQPDHAPAARWKFSDGLGEFGVIPTMTNPFCGNCNRLRMTADGFLLRCLFSEKEGRFALRDKIRRDDYSDEQIADVFREVVAGKKLGQDRDMPDIYDNPGKYLQGSRAATGVTMSQIGG